MPPASFAPAAMLSDMKILIVGAGGLVGKEFARQFSKGHQVLGLTHSELDIRDTPVSAHIMISRWKQRVS